MNLQDIEYQLNLMTAAGSRAIGLLSALISTGSIPKVHREQAGAIVAQFDQASASIAASKEAACYTKVPE